MMSSQKISIMLDPEISEFVAIVTEAYSSLPPTDQCTVHEMREFSESARRPWSKGGPAMLRTDDMLAEVRDRSVHLRIYRPAGAPALAPALIYLHGGGWALFSTDTHDRIMREYATRACLAVIGVDYSRAPETQFPEPVYEIACVVEWLAARAAELGLDASRLFIGGDSAGANLSVATALALREAGHAEPLSGMVLIYGVFDASFDRPSYVKYTDFFLTRENMQWFWGNYVRTNTDLIDPLASVLHADLSGLPPAFLVIAEHDVLFDENVEMAERLRLAGVPVEAKVYPGTVHSFLEAVSIAEVSRRAFTDASDWLKLLCSIQSRRDDMLGI